MQTQKTSTDSVKPGPDWGAVLLLILSLALSVLVGGMAFRWSRDFFARTAMIQVGDAPPVPVLVEASPTPEADSINPGEQTTPLPSTTPRLSEPVETKPWTGGPVTVLIMGLDYRDWLEGVDVPRTDTMILLSIDPQKKTAGMLSIPRDMWVGIPGFSYSRINTAYRDGEIYKLPGGGMGLAMKTVEAFVGVPVDYAALIDFNSFVKFIDTLGGLDMHIRETIKVDPIGPGNTRVLEPGVQTLDGATALAYARNRYTQDGDFDRSKRQQEVIMALRDQIINFHQLPVLIKNAPKLYHELSSGIRTNLTLDQVIQLALLAAQVDEKDIQRGVFDPHKDVGYASVMTKDGAASVLVPNPDQIRLLRDRVFGGSTLGPGAGGDLASLMKAENARVTVINGTRKADQAQRAGDVLRSLGVNIVEDSGSSPGYSQTNFIVHSGKPYTLRFLMETLKLPNSRIKIDYDPAASIDIEAIIGSDWTGLLP